MTYRLIHGDCLEEMAKLEPASVDMILTDPPYGSTACSWDNIIPFDPMWEAIKRVRKPRAAVVLFGSEPFSSMLRVSNLKEYKYDWVWDKLRMGNFLTAKLKPLMTHENICVFPSEKTANCHDSNMNYHPQMEKRNKEIKYKKRADSDLYARKNTLSIEYKSDLKYPKSIIKFARKRDTIHPTQKPVALMEYLIKTYTNPGAVVLDFTTGSGSAGVAAVKLGRDFIGIDNGYCEKEGSEWYGRPWVDVAHHRIANAAGDFVLSESERKTGQMALFEAIR